MACACSEANFSNVQVQSFLCRAHLQPLPTGAIGEHVSGYAAVSEMDCWDISQRGN